MCTLVSQTKRIRNLNQLNKYPNKKFRKLTEKKNKLMTNIENLSNELFYEIFDYLDGCDIFNAFSNLNIRFQNLLNNSSLLLKIDLYSEKNLLINCKTIIIPNIYRIISLNFFDELILDKFFSYCNINQSFKNLQSLTLNSIPAYKFTVILFDLISLPNLSTLKCSLTSCFLDVSYIYRIIFRFKNLIYFKLSLPIIEDLEDFEQAIFVVNTYEFSYIEYLNIDLCCTLDDFISIISYIPKLKHLTCQTLFESNKYIEKNLNLNVSLLTHLFIDKCLLKFNLFEIIIKKICFKLQVIKINIYSHDLMYLDADRWEELIKQNIPYLKKFYFQYYEDFNPHIKLTSFHQLIPRFSSKFWIEKQWIFSLKLDNNNLIYSIQPHKKMWYESDNYSQFDMKYLCSSISAESFNEYFSSIFLIMKITYLDIDCCLVPLLTCIKLLRLLPELNSFKISSLSLTEAKRLSVEKSKIIHTIAYNNKIVKVNLNQMIDFGQIQFLLTLCPTMEYFQTSFINQNDLKIFIESILIKQNNYYITRLSTLCINIQYKNDQIIQDLYNIIEFKNQLSNYKIQQIGNYIYLYWNAQLNESNICD